MDEPPGHTGCGLSPAPASRGALELVSKHPDEIEGLIIESAFAHVIPLLQRLGADLTRSDLRHTETLRQTEKIRVYKGPTLIIHGDDDSIIPFEDAQTLHDSSSGLPKQLLKIVGGNHNNLLLVGSNEYMGAVSDLSDLLRKAKAGLPKN